MPSRFALSDSLINHVISVIDFSTGLIDSDRAVIIRIERESRQARAVEVRVLHLHVAAKIHPIQGIAHREAVCERGEAESITVLILEPLRFILFTNP